MLFNGERAVNNAAAVKNIVATDDLATVCCFAVVRATTTVAAGIEVGLFCIFARCVMLVLVLLLTPTLATTMFV